MLNLIIVGAGQIGSRHLQALAMFKKQYRVWVVDPSERALLVAEERFAEVSGDAAQVVYSTELPLGQIVDLAIIATSAAHRLNAFKGLLKNNRLKNIIFEKVLFQSVEQIQECAELLKRNNIKAWVNCPRRTFGSYANLKSIIADGTALTMTVSGKNFGLACNGIHFLDLFAFFSGESEFTINSILDREIIEAKREGCYEVFGQFEVSSGQDILFLKCESNGNEAAFTVEFATDTKCYVIDEIKQRLSVYDNHRNLLEEFSFPIPAQSQLSHLYVESIVSTGHCKLPCYEESALLHEQFIDALAGHFERVYPNKFENCPIS